MTKRILIVEDDPHIRIGLVEALESKGFQVAECRDGRHAIPAVQERKPDLVILDIMLPHKSGYDICRELREAGNGSATGSTRKTRPVSLPRRRQTVCTSV